jgi:hypothetical protein
MTNDDLRVNGNLIAWGSHILRIDGDRWYGITSMSWDQARERVFGAGMNRAHAPIGRTSGKYVPGVLKTTMYKHTAQALRAMLALLAIDGVSYGNTAVPIFLQCAEGENTTTDEFDEACVVKESSDTEENPDPTKETWEWSVMRIKHDGLTLYDSSEGE